MSRFWKMAIGFGLPLGLMTFLVDSLIAWDVSLKTVFSGVFSGVAGGLLFSALLKPLTSKLFSSIIIEIGEDEKLVKEGMANHFKGKEGVGGKLVLTDQRLIFKSHKLNIQNHEESYSLAQIQEVDEFKSLGIIKNGLMISLAEIQPQKFIVDAPEQWITEIFIQKQSGKF